MLLTVTLVSYAQKEKQSGKNYNVLLIMADDLSTDLNVFGNNQIKSPNIDALAEDGLLLKNAYCTVPLCGPSRVAILTGLSPDVTKTPANKKYFRDEVPNAITLPQLFKEHGYFSGRVGKIFHMGVPGEIGTSGLDDPRSWNKVVNPKGVDVELENKVINYTPEMGLGSAAAYLAVRDTIALHTDELVAAETIELLKENKDKPFFIAAGFFRPHCPYISPKRFFDQYPLNEIRLPHSPPRDRDDIPKLALQVYKEDMGMTKLQQREIIRAYYASISFMDEQVGKLMRALDEFGLRENTIVIFMSDHGYSLGEHGMWQKRNLFEEATKTPVIISVPGMEGVSKETERIIEFIDIYPTIADIAGLKAPSYLQGKSFKVLLNDPEADFGGTASMAVQRKTKNGSTSMGESWQLRGRSLRIPGWRYTEWDEGENGVELYNRNSDPKEYYNLANDDTYRDTIQFLSKLLQKRVKENLIFRDDIKIQVNK